MKKKRKVNNTLLFPLSEILNTSVRSLVNCAFLKISLPKIQTLPSLQCDTLTSRRCDHHSLLFISLGFATPRALIACQWTNRYPKTCQKKLFKWSITLIGLESHWQWLEYENLELHMRFQPARSLSLYHASNQWHWVYNHNSNLWNSQVDMSPKAANVAIDCWCLLNSLFE